MAGVLQPVRNAKQDIKTTTLNEVIKSFLCIFVLPKNGAF